MDKQLVKVENKMVRIEGMSLSTKARRRMRTSREETKILEKFYDQNASPNKEQKEEIAKVVQMGAKNVHFWFQNRRAKDNKKRKMIEKKQKEFVQQYIHQQLHGGPSSQQYTRSVREQKPKFFKDKFKLPPISSFMDQNKQLLDIPFYFHHKHFGIEYSMLQEMQRNSSGAHSTNSPGTATTGHY